MRTAKHDGPILISRRGYGLCLLLVEIRPASFA